MEMKKIPSPVSHKRNLEVRKKTNVITNTNIVLYLQCQLAEARLNPAFPFSKIVSVLC